ncbi:hypothetical protein Tco_0926559 [Tanacetum coccineum]|uniref:CCHC-type domain-containing protein n=1 Tax=Tanacetum coccineum TaxID=301880 RepID=A0ABQ5DA56_9ASTR
MALISTSFMKIYKPINNNLRTSSNTRNKNVDNTLRISRYTRQTGQYENQRVVNVAGNMDTVGNQTGIQCYNCKGFGHTTRKHGLAKRAKDSSYHKDNIPELEAYYMYMAKIQEVIPAADEGTGPVFDKEPLEHVHTNDEYNVFAMENEHLVQHESINDTYVMEQCDSNTTPDSSDMSNNGEEADQDEQKFQEERALIASLIEQMKLEIDECKRMNNV